MRQGDNRVLEWQARERALLFAYRLSILSIAGLYSPEVLVPHTPPFRSNEIRKVHGFQIRVRMPWFPIEALQPAQNIARDHYNQSVGCNCSVEWNSPVLEASLFAEIQIREILFDKAN